MTWSTWAADLAPDSHESSVVAAPGAQPVWAKQGETLVVAAAQPNAHDTWGAQRLREDARALTAPHCRASRRAPTRTPSVSRPRDERDGIRRMHACLWPIAGPRA